MPPSPTPTTVPTSFVPKQPVRPGSHFSKSGGNTFLYVAFGLLGLAVLSGVGVFGYQQFLNSVRDTKAQEVAKARASINTDTVEEFIRTRNRFTSANTLLENHIAASGFFAFLEEITLEQVRFNSLTFKLEDDRSASIQMDGIAGSFNALAAQSSALSGQKKVQRAIFSDIRVGSDGTVTFSLSAELDPRLLAFTKEALPVETIPESDPFLPGASTTPETAAPLEESATSSPTL